MNWTMTVPGCARAGAGGPVSPCFVAVVVGRAGTGTAVCLACARKHVLAVGQDDANVEVRRQVARLAPDAQR